MASTTLSRCSALAAGTSSRKQSSPVSRWTLTTSGACAKCSMPTAQRDIKELIDHGVLGRNEGGSKNTSYSLVTPELVAR